MLRRCSDNDKTEKNKVFPVAQKAQVFIEYTMVLGVVVMVFIGMNTLIKRGIQGMVKVVADQVGVQNHAEQSFDETGHLENSYVSTRVTADKTTREFAGVTSYIFGDVILTDSNASINLGFTSEN